MGIPFHQKGQRPFSIRPTTQQRYPPSCAHHHSDHASSDPSCSASPVLPRCTGRLTATPVTEAASLYTTSFLLPIPIAHHSARCARLAMLKPVPRPSSRPHAHHSDHASSDPSSDFGSSLGETAFADGICQNRLPNCKTSYCEKWFGKPPRCEIVALPFFIASLQEPTVRGRHSRASA